MTSLQHEGTVTHLILPGAAAARVADLLRATGAPTGATYAHKFEGASAYHNGE